MNKLYCEDCGQPICLETEPEEGDEPSVCDDCAREWARIDMEIDQRLESYD